MMECNEATQLISESQERRLTLRERFWLKIHLLMCHICNNFKNTVKFLGLQARNYGADDSPADTTTDSVCLSSEARDRIRRAMEDSQG